MVNILGIPTVNIGNAQIVTAKICIFWVGNEILNSMA